MDTRSASQKRVLTRSVREDRQRRIRKTIIRGRRRKRIRAALKEIIPGACIGTLTGMLLIYAIATDPAPEYEPYRFQAYNGQWYTPEEYEQFEAEKAAYEESEQADVQKMVSAIHEAQERYELQQEQAWLAYTDRIMTGSSMIASRDWGSEDAYLLAKIAMAEAEGEDTEGKALVILTVLNRVWSPQFPGTIEDVIAEKNAFSSYSNGRYDRVEPDEDCWAALALVQIEHWDESQGALYFERTPDPGESTWHSRNLVTLFIHGNHTFYREEERDGD